MRVKHYKLLASVAMLISLLGLPVTYEVEAIEFIPVTEVIAYEENCPKVEEVDPLKGRKEYVHKLLKGVYKVDQSHIDWWTYNITEATARYGVPEDRMIAMLAVESKFEPYPKRNNGSIGPSQVLGKYWKNNGKYNIYKPDENIFLGAMILRSYKDQCGNWDCALGSYNVGIGAHLRGESKGKQRHYLSLINKNLALIESYNKKRA